LQYAHTALDVFQSKAGSTFVEFIEIVLRNSTSVVVNADIEFVVAEILGHMYKAGVTVFQDIIHQFLDNAEDEQFLFRAQPVAIIMEPAAGVDGAGS